MDEDIRQPMPPGFVPNVRGSAARTAAEPSWGQLLATTIKVWVLRQLRSASRWGLAVGAVALAAIAAAALLFAGVFTPGSAPTARTSSPGDAATGQAGSNSGLSSGAAAQAAAATWVADQVSADAIIACEPAMCAALQAQGVAAGRLMLLPAGVANPHGASVILTSTSSGSKLADRYAPAVIASFGSGKARIEARATEPGGSAAYQSALRADLAARTSAGLELLRNRQIRFTAQDTAQLLAGEVDARLLVTLAGLSPQFSIRVAGFGDASPGVPALFREMTIAISGSGDGSSPLAVALALVRAQHLPYLPDHATIVHPAAGQAALHIEFAAPSPLGLLTAVLLAQQRRAAAPATASTGASFPKAWVQ